MTALDALTPHLAAVDAARAALDAHNRNPAANPLDGLAIAGRVLRHQQTALDTATHALRYAQWGTEDPVTLQIHGCLNRLAVIGGR